MTNFIKAGTRADLDKKGKLSVSALGKKIGIFKQKDGTVYAREMNCKHQGADMNLGAFQNGTVTCPRHGWKYDLESGECLNQKMSPSLRAHEISIEGEQILVSLNPTPRNNPTW